EFSASAGVVANPYVTGNERFVYQAYLDLLHRQADAPGLAVWANYLNQGGTPGVVVQGITGRLEYRTGFVNEAYGGYLIRAAEASGLTLWLGFPGTHSAHQFKAAMLGSTEYFQLSGSDNVKFLKALYLDVLGRGLDAVGQATWVNQLNMGVQRGTVAQQVLA